MKPPTHVFFPMSKSEPPIHNRLIPIPLIQSPTSLFQLRRLETLFLKDGEWREIKKIKGKNHGKGLNKRNLKFCRGMGEKGLYLLKSKRYIFNAF